MLTLGKPVPDFSLPSTGGSTFRLADQRGKKLALCFYPKDNTVSRGSLESHESCKATMQFPFELLSDPEEKACGPFGVTKDMNLYEVPGHVEEVSNFAKAL